MATQTTRIDVECHFDCRGGEETIQDLDMYILAVYSYPDQFADKPHLSFSVRMRGLRQACTQLALMMLFGLPAFAQLGTDRVSQFLSNALSYAGPWNFRRGLHGHLGGRKYRSRAS